MCCVRVDVCEEEEVSKSKQMCSGCRNDFYNGNNNLGVSECWSYKDAKVVNKIRVGLWESPPYRNKATGGKRKTGFCLNCFSPYGSIMVSKEYLDSKGYWRR